MDIHSDSYRIAPLDEHSDAVEIIRKAEAALAQLPGQKGVTLIAYEKAEHAEHL